MIFFIVFNSKLLVYVSLPEAMSKCDVAFFHGFRHSVYSNLFSHPTIQIVPQKFVAKLADTPCSAVSASSPINSPIFTALPWMWPRVHLPSPPSGPKDLPYAKHLPGEPDQGQEEDGTHQDTALEIEE